MAHEADEMTSIIARAVKMALAEDRADRDRQSALHTEAAVAAALANQTSQTRSLRKPDLPPLDKKNIEHWINRVEYAYTRAEVTRPKEKFAFLERTFSGCDDAQINRMLQGDSAAQWTVFLDHLRDTYGRTTRQKVQTVFNGVARDGRRPTQLAAHIKDLVDDITLDDILKELLLKEIPSEVRQHSATAIKSLDFQQTAEHLEVYFDKQGKLLNSNQASASVNSVKQQPQQQQRSSMKPPPSAPKASSESSTPSSEASSFTNAFGDDDDNGDINAVRFRPNGQRQSFDISNGSRSRGRFRGGVATSSSSSGGNSGRQERAPSRGRYSSFNNDTDSRGTSGTRQNKVCTFHNQYGEKARSCREGCMLYAKHQASKGQASN